MTSDMSDLLECYGLPIVLELLAVAVEDTDNRNGKRIIPEGSEEHFRLVAEEIREPNRHLAFRTGNWQHLLA